MADESQEPQKRVVVASIPDSPMAGAHAVARSLTEQGIAASRAASAGTRMAAGSGVMSMGLGGIPSGPALPSVLATGSPLSVFQYTLSRADRLALFRYFARSDPFVSRAIELHSELPLSRLSIGPPKGPSTKQNKEINRLYENMVERLGLLEFLLEVAREYWLVGDVYIWHEWDEEIQEWADLYVLPVEYCHSIMHPFMRRREMIIFARPLVDTASIRRMTDRDLYMLAGDPDLEDLLEEVEDDLPTDLKAILDYGEGHVLNTDWRKGSFVYHLARNRPPNEAYGLGLLERCLEALLRLENLKNAQLQISGRNMQPKHLVYGEALSNTELNDLRTQVDLAILDNVDYPIVTNYPVHWETIGAQQRLLNVETEYTTLREDLATGLGTTKEMLTGQATYGGQRITLELMNTQYLTFRELIKEYVERCIFRPVAEAKGHYFYEETSTWVRVNPEELEVGDDIIQEYDGSLRKRKVQINKKYNHSKLRFNRLSIRDNSEVYEQLFQLHQKGSLALRYLLDIHNIDPEENSAALLEDLATVRDPVFNSLLQTVYQNVSQPIIEETDIVERIVKGLNLDPKSKIEGEPSPGTPPEGMMGAGLGGAPMDTAMPPPPMGGGGGMDMGGPPTPGAGGPPGGGPPPDAAAGGPPGGGPPPDASGLPGTPATVPAPAGAGAASSKKASKKEADPILPGQRLSKSQVKSIVAEVKAGKKLTRKALKQITTSPPEHTQKVVPMRNGKVQKPKKRRSE